MKKTQNNKMLAAAIFLIGIVMLMESAATMLVLVAAPSSNAFVGWVYVLVKSVISLFAIITGLTSMKK